MAAIVLIFLFPFTVDVGPDGVILVTRDEGVFGVDPAKGVATPIYCPEGDKVPVWARWSPDGKKMMFILEDKKSDVQEFWTANADGTAPKKTYECKSVAYALWSPDGKHISVGLGAEGKIGFIDAAEGKEGRRVIGGVFPTHAWTAGPKNIAAFKMEGRTIRWHGGSHIYQGVFTLFAAEEDSFKVVARAVCEKHPYLASSPDGERMVFVARAAADAGANVPEDVPEAASLFEVDLKTLKRQGITEASEGWAAYSPDGKRLAYSAKGEKSACLYIRDIAGGEAKAIAEDIATNTGGDKAAKILPVWLSNSKLLFWREVEVPGKDEKVLTAFEVNADGTGLRNVQEVIDKAILAASKKENTGKGD